MKDLEMHNDIERLKANDPTLTMLGLLYNDIRDDGSKALADALKVNTKVKVYGLKNDY